MNQYEQAISQARCVFNLNDGGDPVTYIAQQGIARPLHALLSEPVDVRAVARMEGYFAYPRDAGLALKHAARMCGDLAQAMRAARWAGKPPVRLGAGWLPDGGPQEQMPSALGCLCSAAAGLPDVAPEKVEEVLAGIKALLMLSCRYPGISPAVEARLARTGYTAAELLVLTACRLVADIAQAEEQAHALGGSDVRRKAAMARRLAEDAVRVLDAGLRHSLEPVEAIA